MILLALLAQAPIASMPAPPPPLELPPREISLNARVRAKSVTIEKSGQAELTVRSAPEGGNLVEVRAPDANGRKTIRDVDVTIRAEARIADPANLATTTPRVACAP